MISSILTSLLATLAALLVGLGAAAAGAAERIYIPLGSANKIVIIDPAKGAVVGEIKGVPAVHGLATTPDGRLLIAGSYAARKPGSGMPKKPAGVSESEHKAHHAKRPAGAHGPSPALSTVSIIDAAKGVVVRRIDVPGAVHHVAVSPIQTRRRGFLVTSACRTVSRSDDPNRIAGGGAELFRVRHQCR